MQTAKSRTNFISSEEGQEARTQLTNMLSNQDFNTRSTYSGNTEQYPDNVISFVEKHLNYLVKHPAVDVQQYLANVRLMTRIR
jgi:hypothetical protein